MRTNDKGDVIEIMLDGEIDIRPILFRNRRHVELGAREIEALVARENAACRDLAHESSRFIDHQHTDHAVVDEDALPDLNVVHQARGIGADEFGGCRGWAHGWMVTVSPMLQAGRLRFPRGQRGFWGRTDHP